MWFQSDDDGAWTHLKASHSHVWRLKLDVSWDLSWGVGWNYSTPLLPVVSLLPHDTGTRFLEQASVTRGPGRSHINIYNLASVSHTIISATA